MCAHRYWTALRALFLVLPHDDVMALIQTPECQTIMLRSDVDLVIQCLRAAVDGTVFRCASALRISALLDELRIYTFFVLP